MDYTNTLITVSKSVIRSITIKMSDVIQNPRIAEIIDNMTEEDANKFLLGITIVSLYGGLPNDTQTKLNFEP